MMKGGSCRGNCSDSKTLPLQKDSASVPSIRHMLLRPITHLGIDRTVPLILWCEPHCHDSIPSKIDIATL